MKDIKLYNVAVYGSLRQEMGNNTLLKDYSPRLIIKEILPYFLVDLGGFPGLVPIRDFDSEKIYEIFNDIPTKQEIVLELYKIDHETYKRIEILEGFPSFYQKYTFTPRVLGGEIYEVYVLKDSGYRYIDNPIVISGDWKEYYNEKMEKSYADF